MPNGNEEQSDVVCRLWRPLGFTRNEIEGVLVKARLAPVRGQWGEQSEAMRLTLAWLLRAATNQHARFSGQITTAEERGVVDAARRLAFQVGKLQNLEGRPPAMPTMEDGRPLSELWEAWFRLGQDLSQRGRRPNSDPDVVGRLTAFYQLALQQERPKFSPAEDAPLTRFLKASFECAEGGLLKLQAENGHSGRGHSLHAPKPSALKEQLKQLGANEPNTALVSQLFHGYVLRLQSAS